MARSAPSALSNRQTVKVATDRPFSSRRPRARHDDALAASPHTISLATRVGTTRRG
jgi:hypothetical protein